MNGTTWPAHPATTEVIALASDAALGPDPDALPPGIDVLTDQAAVVIQDRPVIAMTMAAVWSVLERLDVASVVDQVTPRRADAAVTIGTYIALATTNRVVAPCSKAAFARWWESTVGPRFTKVPVTAVDHRRFWKAMDLLGEDDLAVIEAELGCRIVDEFGLDPSGLILDMTDFATFIDSGNDKAPLAQRGKAKQKRVDLLLIGLAMVVTRDGGVPVLSRAYPGNRPDVTQFSGVIDELLDRYRALTHSVEALTVVYDAGQNSTDNHERVEEAGIGFVGSLPPSDHPDLLALPRSRYRPVDEERYPARPASTPPLPRWA